MARLVFGRWPFMFVRRLRVAFPLRFRVLTLVTRTLKACSTAWRTSILVAPGSTMKIITPAVASELLTAVKNRCFLPLSYDEVTPGPRNAEAIVAIARWLHPTAFGLPADGS